MYANWSDAELAEKLNVSKDEVAAGRNPDGSLSRSFIVAHHYDFRNDLRDLCRQDPSLLRQFPR